MLPRSGCVQHQAKQQPCPKSTLQFGRFEADQPALLTSSTGSLCGNPGTIDQWVLIPQTSCSPDQLDDGLSSSR